MQIYSKEAQVFGLQKQSYKRNLFRLYNFWNIHLHLYCCHHRIIQAMFHQVSQPLYHFLQILHFHRIYYICQQVDIYNFPQSKNTLLRIHHRFRCCRRHRLHKGLSYYFRMSNCNITHSLLWK
jgi:hypothetical protein